MRLRLALLALPALLPLAAAPARAADHLAPPPAVPWAAQRTLDSLVFATLPLKQNSIGMNITNYGFIGTNFTTRTPSFEYPLGSAHDHLVRGGPWIGALAADDNGAFTGVTTAALDGSAGSASANASEYSPEDDHITVRSTLPNDRAFSTQAVSEQDYISHFNDLLPKRSLDNSEDHRSLHLEVKQENYAWSFSDYASIVFFHYVVRNTGQPLRQVWVGLYDELASGNKNSFSNFPNGIGPWFSKKQIAWNDSLRLFTERFCQAVPIPNNCAYSLVPEIVGLKLLGVTPDSLADTLNKHVTLACWNYFPGSPARDEDVERYAIMSSGQKTTLVPMPDSLNVGTGDPVELIAAGPFPSLAPGDSLTFDFAYLGATDDATMIKRAIVAQRAYNLNYRVPVPPPSPHMHVVARDQALDIYWDDTPESFVDPTSPIGRDFEGYRVYVGQDRNAPQLVEQVDLATPPHDTTGFNTGLGPVTLPQPAVFDGIPYPYRYTVAGLRNGFKYFVATTAYDLGTTEIESLESGIAQNEVVAIPAPGPGEHPGQGVTVFPNPYRVEAGWDQGQNVRNHFLWFANLPEQCTLRIYTLAGDLIYQTDFDGRSYDGSNARGIYSPPADLRPTMSGRTFGWDMITRNGQAAATGLYLWSVVDRNGGAKQVGKFLLVKSDREPLQ